MVPLSAWLAVLLAAVSSAEAATPARGESRWLDVRDELRSMQREASLPVLVLVVLEDGRPALISTSTLDGSTTFSREAPFRWGSISKTVTALVLIEAARRQGVDLSAAVSDVLEPVPFRNPWAPRLPISLAHLVELTTGLPDLGPEEFADNVPHPLDEALARGVHQRVALWPPGLQHSYSNVPPGISAAVVEKLTGSSFETAAEQLVFEPLGMKGASFLPVAGLPGGFQADGHTEIPYWHMTFRAFGALNASPDGMARLLEALLNQGHIGGMPAVDPDSAARMFRSETSLGARHGLDITYSAGLYGWVRDGHVFQGHGGDADGYRSRFGLLTDARRGYLLGINIDDPSLLRRMQNRVERALIADLPVPPAPAPADLPAQTLTRYSGTYYPSSFRFDIDGWRAGKAAMAHIEVNDGHLWFHHRGSAERLIPVAADQFRREGDPAVSAVFATLDGTLYLQGELGNFVRTTPGPCASFIPVCWLR